MYLNWECLKSSWYFLFFAGLTFLKPKVAKWRYNRGSRALATNLSKETSGTAEKETVEPHILQPNEGECNMIFKNKLYKYYFGYPCILRVVNIGLYELWSTVYTYALCFIGSFLQGKLFQMLVLRESYISDFISLIFRYKYCI